jgi:hypothetical protein
MGQGSNENRPYQHLIVLRFQLWIQTGLQYSHPTNKPTSQHTNKFDSLTRLA